uniref:Uncharacterized protein n=1 Tax=Timema shepardi TaxID=629360 RepID=A0A7R9FX46_TIMSH|nr:unnamed protein product [Timema shepardi]
MAEFLWRERGKTFRKKPRSARYSSINLPVIGNLIYCDSDALEDAATEAAKHYCLQFIKELHVSFVKHLEELWHGLSAMVQHHWNTMLETIEPTFIHLIHYLEVLSWKASKEILGKELQAIMLEIIGEFRELEKLPSIQFAIKKFNEIYAKFMWFYDYLDVGNRFQRAVTLIHSKLTDITQTALQAENRESGKPFRKKQPPVHPTEIRTSISPSSAVELNTSALAYHATEAGNSFELNTTSALANYATESGLIK